MVAKGLAKLHEDCGEVCPAAGEFLHAVITQSAHEHHGKLRLDLQDELADLWAARSFVAETFEPDTADQDIEANTVSARPFYDTQTLTRLVGATGAQAQVAAKKLAYFDTDEHPDGASSLAARRSQCIEEFLACAGAGSASHFCSVPYTRQKASFEVNAENSTCHAPFAKTQSLATPRHSPRSLISRPPTARSERTFALLRCRSITSRT
jgi:hypothetical protein